MSEFAKGDEIIAPIPYTEGKGDAARVVHHDTKCKVLEVRRVPRKLLVVPIDTPEPMPREVVAMDDAKPVGAPKGQTQPQATVSHPS